jgi:hypothetical protein
MKEDLVVAVFDSIHGTWAHLHHNAAEEHMFKQTSLEWDVKIMNIKQMMNLQ